MSGADKSGQTREKQKTSKPPLQELNPSVSLTIKLDLVNSQKVRIRNVSSVVKRQRGGLCLEGVSCSFLRCWGVLMFRLLVALVGRLVDWVYSCISYLQGGAPSDIVCG
jgi:hypothetical protein